MAELWGPWAAMPPAHQQAMRDGEAAERRQEAERANDDRERAWDRQQQAEYTARMIQWQTGHSSSELREAGVQWASARELRDPQAEYGSEARPALRMADVELAPIERSRGGALGRSVLGDEQLLARAREVGANSFMRAEVARYDARRGGKPVISRSGDHGDGPDCTHCIEAGATAEESYLLHADPELPPLPYGRVPDYAPQRSKRVRAGTGWPELVR